MPIKSRMSSILGQIELEHPEFLNVEKLRNLTLFSIYKYRPINTKLGQNVSDHKTPGEFDYGSYETRTV